MNKADMYFLDNLNNVLKNGSWDESPRGKYASDGRPAHSKFITQVFEAYDLDKGEFPLPSINPTAKKSGIEEMLWMYLDESNSLDDLAKRGVTWWDNWDIGDRTIGQRYGATVKKYRLMFNLLYNLEHNPYSRRHMINLWQEQDLLDTDGLPPCAFMTEWSVRKDTNDSLLLDMHLHQRSNDYLMAGYINKVQYVALQMMVAGHLRVKGIDIRVGKFSHYVNNLHVYNRHIESAEIVVTRTPIEQNPYMALRLDKLFKEYTADDIMFVDAEHYSRHERLDISV